MRRHGPIVVLLLVLLGASRPAGATTPEERLEEVGRSTGGALHPYLRRSGTLRAGARQLNVPLVGGCANVMIAVEPADAAVSVRFSVVGDADEAGERTGEGIWEAHACLAMPLTPRRAPQRASGRLVLRGPAGTRFAVWAYEMPGLIGMLGSATPTNAAADVLRDMAAQMPRTTARVSIADVTTEGTLTGEQARRVLAMPHGLLACWRDPVETDPSLAGDRALLFVVAPTGAVLAVSLRPDARPATIAPARCTIELLQRTTFAATTGGTTSRVRAVLRVTADTRNP